MHVRVKLLRFDAAKKSLQNNVLSYVEKILISLFFRFEALTEGDAKGLRTDERAFSGDTSLQDVCSILDTTNWIFLEGVIPNFKNIQFKLDDIF